MTRSDSIAALIAALVKAQPHIKTATKSSTNPHFKSKYADLAEIEEACMGALNAAGIAVLQPTRADGQHVTVTTMIAHSSGEWLAEDLTLDAVQNTPQAVGSAITYGRRYGLAAMVGVAPDDDDGNAASRQTGFSVDPPAKVVDTRTGEEVAPQSRPAAPEGYHYIGAYTFKAPWHEFTVLGWDAQGGAMNFSTKTKVGELACEAFQRGVPIQVVDFTPKKNGRGGEAYINKLHVWSPEPDDDLIDPRTDDSIPF